MGRTVFVVSHTHWDREWYLTYHQFRVNLVRVVRQVLDALESETAFRHFVLDGQSLLLEDFFAACPEETDRLRRLAVEGKLSLGPWYVLSDEFLVRGESTVRNLLLGHAVAAHYGPVQKVGYMPDPFGHIAQMPQILRGAGIDSFIFTRGSGDEIDDLGLEFTWRAPDGSEVLAIHQCEGYCNAAGLGHEEMWHAHTPRRVDLERAVEHVRGLFAKMEARSNGDVWLLNNGCDHFPPQRELGRVLEALGDAFPDTKFRHASFSDYIDAVRSRASAERVYSGDLLGGKLHHALSGVWSARIGLKQKNDACETLLADCLEPVSAYVHFMHGDEYPGGIAEYAWKLLLQNHAHDSICGCSTDAVHREMETRFAGVMETAEETITRQLQRLLPTFAREAPDDRPTRLCVLNPLPERRTEVVERLVVLQPLDYNIERLRLMDDEGRQVPFEITSVRYVERFWGVDYRMLLTADAQHERFRDYEREFADRILRTEAERDRSDCFLTIRYLAEDLPGVGHALYALEERDAPPPETPGRVAVTADQIENEHCRVRLYPNGTLDVLDKRTGNRFTGLNELVDIADVGDSYDHAPCPDSEEISSRGATGEVRIVDQGGLRGTLEAAFTLDLPSAVTSDRAKRVESTVGCPVRVRVTLDADNPLVRIQLFFENNASDHRLQARFPTGVESKVLVSDGQFAIRRQPIEPPTGEDWVQPPSGTMPQQEFSLVESDGRGLALLGRGLPEVATGPDGNDGVTMALTLLRSIGWLSRDDFETRKRANAGPTLFTPDAQCLGAHRFEYALFAYDGDHVAAGVKRHSRRYRVPILSVQGVADQAIPGGEGLVEVGTSSAVTTAIKKHEERNSLIIRLNNPGDGAIEETLTFGRDIARVWRVNLLEERLSEVLPGSPRTVTASLGPYAIQTLDIEFV